MFVFNYEGNLTQKLEYATSFDLFVNGEVINKNKTTKEFETYLSLVKTLFQNSRLMPAFGVSLHDETLNALNDGTWLQINFEKPLNENGLPFESLLFKLEKTGGINLIRKHNNRYEGRCVFLDFNNEIDLIEFFNIS